MSKRKKIKANRKPKLVRDRSWKKRILEGEIDHATDLPTMERVLPRGRQEERVKLRTKVEQELELEASPQPEAKISKDWSQGVVIRVSTGLYDVDLGKETLLCSVRGSLSATQTGYTNVVAVGDKVLLSRDGAGRGVIEHVLPRETVLARPDSVNPDLSQIIVSNIDQLLIVTSWEEPPLWLELIDRYLIAAAEGKMEPLICLNKIDLAQDRAECREVMKIYSDLGYNVLFTSAVTGQGIDQLRQNLTDSETVLAGLSGVGKSSLLMAVQPDLELEVAQVSDYSGEGRHTTTQVSLLKLDQGGYVVDTPGIRELGLSAVHRHELILHYPDIESFVSQCRFNDCTHTHEPGCAVIQALEDGLIAPSRYHSYQSIYESLPEYYTE